MSREHGLTALPGSGNPRCTAGSGPRGIFKVLKTHKIVFVDPTVRLKLAAAIGGDLRRIRDLFGMSVAGAKR